MTTSDDMGDSRAFEVPDETLAEWQSMVDTMAKLAGVPAGLVMRLRGPDIEVLVSSDTAGNPYHPGDAEHFDGSGLYCETAIRNGTMLKVPDALSDPEWRTNPDVKLGMISYLGYPIRLPDGVPFGTLCILDAEPNGYDENVEQLVMKFRDLIEHHLGLLQVTAELGAENASYREHLAEIRALRGLIPICSWCKDIRTEDGYWESVERYLASHPDVAYTHGICPSCEGRLAPELQAAE